MSEFTVADLMQTMRECAGEDESIDFGGDIIDRSFDELGYDSLAVMETSSRIERMLGISLPEEAMEHVTTPAALVDLVNDRLAAKV